MLYLEALTAAAHASAGKHSTIHSGNGIKFLSRASSNKESHGGEIQKRDEKDRVAPAGSERGQPQFRTAGKNCSRSEIKQRAKENKKKKTHRRPAQSIPAHAGHIARPRLQRTWSAALPPARVIVIQDPPRNRGAWLAEPDGERRKGKKTQRVETSRSICLAKARQREEEEPARSVDPAIKSRLVCAASSSSPTRLPHRRRSPLLLRSLPRPLSLTLDSPRYAKTP